MEIILGLAITAVLILGLNFFQTSRLKDPENKNVIYVSELLAVCAIKSGQVSAVLTRQSGSMYRDLGTFPNVERAIVEVSKSLNRAQIDSLTIITNTSEKVVFVRAFRQNGKAEGKKLGGAIITRMS